ncbi:MAG TPA: protein kinase, partial [Planctomycetaceae bacterium]
MADRFEAELAAGRRPRIESFVAGVGPDRDELLRELIAVEVDWRLRAGEVVTAGDYAARFPEVSRGELAELIPVSAEEPTRLALAGMTPPRAPAAGRSTVYGGLDDAPPRDGGASLPRAIGRYRVERLLGQGGFGVVYLAHDEQLARRVAVKVPHPRRLAVPGHVELYLREARTVAGLDHPHIVPVYDAGSAEGFPFFVVSKYVDGITLAAKARSHRYTPEEAAELTATLCDALHY